MPSILILVSFGRNLFPYQGVKFPCKQIVTLVVTLHNVMYLHPNQTIVLCEPNLDFVLSRINGVTVPVQPVPFTGWASFLFWKIVCGFFPNMALGASQFPPQSTNVARPC